MDLLRTILDKLGETGTSNQIRAIVALLAIPGAVWGLYLFIRWLRGKGLATEIDRLHQQQHDTQQVLLELRAQLTKLAQLQQAGPTGFAEADSSPTTSPAPRLQPSKPVDVSAIKERAFVSYARQDAGRVLDIVKSYEAAGSKDVFLDIHDVQPGEDFAAAIRKAIDSAGAFVLFWSRAASQSEFLQHEIASALPRIQQGQLKLLAIALDDTPLPPHLARYHFTRM